MKRRAHMKLPSSMPIPVKNTNIIRFSDQTRLPPAKVHEVRARLTEGVENVWYEYVPKSYTGQKAVPLVVQLHGGGTDGFIWTKVTAWHLLAEREGFIVVYPNSIMPGRWNCDERDIGFLAKLIEHVNCKYCIDESRVYMQGMSNGEMMTLAFTMAHPEMLAAAGNITGPSPQEMIGDERPAGALPLLQMRGEKDVFFQLPDPLPEDIYAKRYGMNDLNREIWEGVNGTKGLPVLDVRGKDNFLLYQGERAPIINWEIKDVGHKEPADGSQVLWDYLYSGCRRTEGKLVFTAPNKAVCADANSAVVALGSNKAYKSDHLELLHPSEQGYARTFGRPPVPGGNIPPEMADKPGLYIPVEGLKALFGAKTEMLDPGEEAIAVFPNGRKYRFYANSELLYEDDAIRSFRKPCVLMSGMFFLPIEEFAGDILGMHISFVEGALLITAHYAELGRYTARILKKLMQ